MKCTQIVIVKVSPRAGHIKSFWVQEVRPDGWVRAHYEQDQHPFLGTWFAPHNVVCFTEPHFNYDYGGISEGTLVQNIDVVGMVVRRRGPSMMSSSTERSRRSTGRQFGPLVTRATKRVCSILEKPRRKHGKRQEQQRNPGVLRHS